MMRQIPLDWRCEIENFIRRRIREHLKEKYLKEAKKLRNELPLIDISQAEIIREDRNKR